MSSPVPRGNVHEDVNEDVAKVKSNWATTLREKDFGTYLLKKVDVNLFDKIANTFKPATCSNPDAKAAASKGIEDFLFGEDEKNLIDDCILWLLLFCAAGKEPGDLAYETSKIVGEMIITRNNNLAFETLDNSYPSAPPRNVGEGKPIKDRCKIHSQRWKAESWQGHFKSKVKGTPFHRAAKNGNFAIMKLIRDSLKDVDKANRGAIYDVIKGGDPARTKTTALQYVIEAEYGGVETLEVLLGFDCLSSSSELDAIFASAVEDGAERVVDAFLDGKGLEERFAKSEHILTAIREMSRSKSDQRHCYMRMIKRLIELTPPTNPLTDEVVEAIVEQQAIAESRLLLKQGTRAGSEPAQDLMDIWKTAQARPKGVLGNTTSKLLHLAVYHQSLSFVTLCLEGPEYSKSTIIKAALPKSDKRSGAKPQQQYFPLWYNGKVWDDQLSEFVDRAGSTDIRAKLVSSTIRQTNKMQTLSEILYESGQPVRELCFDISRFNSKLYRVSDFVYSLMHHSENENLLSYEETIRYAEFPALDLKEDDRESFGDNHYLGVQHTEVFEILDWLRDTKKVQQIVELKVPDRLINPHDEKGIAEVVEKFKVECLDWRCLDLSLSIFTSRHASGKANVIDSTKLNGETKIHCNIKELHLYSSGRRAAIDHWLGSEGIPTLTKLEKLHIHIVRETVTEIYCEDIIRFIFAGLQAMKTKYKNEPTCNFKLDYGTVDSIFWNPTHTLVDLDEIAHRITPRLAKFHKSLAELIVNREKETRNTLRRTRVAIIDNGILSITPRSYVKAGEVRGRGVGDSAEDSTSSKSAGAAGTSGSSSVGEKGTEGLQNTQNPETLGQKSLWPRIKTGRSFVDNGSKVYSWLFASDSHGTQMANLICAMDPFCELYIARVAEGKYGITPERAARAIQWAIEEQVDIISMSIAMLDGGKGDLENAINKAKEKGIVIVSSTYDEGTRTTKSYPAEYRGSGLLVITACDEYGRLLREIDEKEKHQYDYKIHGQDVAAGVIPFVESSEYLTGSSVSTALTAGLSSLVLTCNKLAHLKQNKSGTEGEKKVLPPGSSPNAPGVFPYAEGQREMVAKHLQGMANSRHLVLEKFGDIETTTKEGDDIVAKKILRDKFGMPN